MSDDVKPTSADSLPGDQTSNGKENNQVVDSEGEEVQDPRDTKTDKAADEDLAPKPDKKKRRKFILIGAAALLILAVIGVIYWLYARQYESTDDAFIDGDIVQISPRVSANVTK